MINKKLVTLLSSILGDYTQYPNGEYYFECPLCGKSDGVKKLAVQMDDSKKDKQGHSLYTRWHCWRNTAHKGMNLNHLLKRMNLLGSETHREINKLLNNGTYNGGSIDDVFSLMGTVSDEEQSKKRIKLPPEYLSFNSMKSNDAKTAYNYLINRGVSDEDIIRYDIGYCSSGKYAGYIIVPSYDSEGILNYFVARRYLNDTAMKHKNPAGSKDIIFNELFIDWNLPIILCEGAYDAIAIRRNAIPILGKYIPQSLRKKIQEYAVSDIYIMLDNDAIKDSLKIISEFISSGINVYFVKLEDKDPAKLGYKKSWECINSASIMNFENFIQLKMSI